MSFVLIGYSFLLIFMKSNEGTILQDNYMLIVAFIKLIATRAIDRDNTFIS